MNYVDTHCHIDSIAKRLDVTPESVIADLSENCDAIVHSACEPQSLDFPAELVDNLVDNSKVWFCAGIHPHDASEYNQEVHEKLLTLMKHEKCLAWGEIGLDYFYDKSPREVQISVFKKQLNTAISLDLPIVIHTRDADQDMLDILAANLNESTKVHIHCFTNNSDFAKKLQELPGKIFIGFTGALTFKNSEEIRDALKTIPLCRILLETDGPYMAPVPFRGKCAVPGMIPNIVSVMAQTLNQTEEAIYLNCRQNTKEFYGI